MKEQKNKERKWIKRQIRKDNKENEIKKVNKIKTETKQEMKRT